MDERAIGPGCKGESRSYFDGDGEVVNNTMFTEASRRLLLDKARFDHASGWVLWGASMLALVTGNRDLGILFLGLSFPVSIDAATSYFSAFVHKNRH